ncbi:MAG: hypothetical protein U0531_18415 [Dehalococcoidia bacterium]
MYYATRNRAALLRRHGGRRGSFCFSVDFAATRVMRGLAYLAAGRPDLARALARGWLDAYRGRMGRTFPPP